MKKADSKATVLERFLFPITPERFLSEFWEKKPLHIRGTPDKFQQFFDIKNTPLSVLAQSARFSHVNLNGEREYLVAQPEVLETFLKVGTTVCMTDMAAADPELEKFIGALKAELSFSGTLDARAYVSPDGCGTRTHYDGRIATTLQIDGRKTWRYSKSPAVVFPLENSPVLKTEGGPLAARKPHEKQSWKTFDLPDESDFVEVTLEPGDVLCLPAGTWHSASAVGYSRAINVAFNPALVTTTLEQVLRKRMLENPEWRHSPPPALAQLGTGKMPDSVKNYFRARLDELAELIRSLDPDGPEFSDVWRTGIHSVSPGKAPPPGEEPQKKTEDPPKGQQPITPKAQLCVSVDGPLDFGSCLDQDGLEAVALYQGVTGRRMILPLGIRPFVARLVSQKKFRADASLKWTGDSSAEFDWEDIQLVLTSLRDQGFIAESRHADAVLDRSATVRYRRVRAAKRATRR
jgi:ribosomal protein L16 Arg81 hydroxylase